MDNFLYLPRALASILFDFPFATAFGSLFAVLWLRDVAESHLRSLLRRTLILSATLMLLALPAQLWLLTATLTGSSTVADIRPQLYDVLTATHAGRVLIPDFLCTLLLLLCAPFIAPLPHAMTASRQIEPGAPSCAPQTFHADPKPNAQGGVRTTLYLSLLIAFTLAVFRSASGHAAANGTPSLSEAVQFLHLTSIALWSGAIMVAGWLVLPHLHDLDQLTTFGRRLSTSATVAIVLVALSGIYNAWLGLDGSLKPLPHTQWGVLLMAKSALVLAALGFGARNRLLLARNPSLTPADATRFRRSMQLEAAAMAAILILSGFLANSPPAVGE